MLMQFTDARNLRWGNADHTMVDMEVDFMEVGTVPFTASPDDPEDHGRILYSEALAGTFGVIAAHVPLPAPPEPTKDQLLAELAALTAKINALTE